MELCASCGARLAPDASWCGQCLAQVVRPAADEAAETPLWRRAGSAARPPKPTPTYSRFRAGPTSFGAFGRILMTLALLGALVVGYPMSRGGMLVAVGFDVPGRPFLIGYSVVAGIAGLLLLGRIWKRARVA
jgi:ribosomal protein L40E